MSSKTTVVKRWRMIMIVSATVGLNFHHWGREHELCFLASHLPFFILLILVFLSWNFISPTPLPVVFPLLSSNTGGGYGAGRKEKHWGQTSAAAHYTRSSEGRAVSPQPPDQSVIKLPNCRMTQVFFIWFFQHLYDRFLVFIPLY